MLTVTALEIHPNLCLIVILSQKDMLQIPLIDDDNQLVMLSQ